MSPVAEYVVQTGVSLLGVVALAWIILYAGRRLGVPQLKGPMQLLGRLPLEHRRAICLVKVGERVLVIGTSEAGITKLAELNENELPDLTPVVRRGFADILQATLRRKPPENPREDPRA